MSKKKAEKINGKNVEHRKIQQEERIPDYTHKMESQQNIPPRRFPPVTTLIIFTLIGILIGILFAYGGTPVVSMVNGQPVFRWELANVLIQRYGRQTLQGMVTERLIAEEAKKSGVQITQADIDAKAKQILSNFGSAITVEDFLKFQGMEREDFDHQIKLQLTVEKLLSKDLHITEADVTNFIATNQAKLVATDPAALREEARNAIVEEKVSEQVQSWLEELKRKASIQQFL
jgi:foldase protein PrsA